MKEKDANRNYGIDLLRLLAMFMIVILHSLGQGGILANVSKNSYQYVIAWILEIWAYPAVDIFALISGYVNYNDKEKKLKYSNYLKIWFQVVFYCLVITILFKIFMPNIISINDYFKALLPVSNNIYWYFTAYTGLFIFMPLINNGLRNMDIKLVKKLLFFIIFVFSIFSGIGDIFKLYNGYSFVWIMLLYVLGAGIKKCNLGKNIKNHQIIIGLLLLCIFTFSYKYYSSSISENIFISYISPSVLLSAILYLIGFSRLKLNKILLKIVEFAAPSAFAVYLLNTNNLVWEYIMRNIFLNLTNAYILKFLFIPIIFSLLFVIVSVLIDKVRLLLFKLFHVSSLIDRIIIMFSKLSDYIL